MSNKGIKRRKPRVVKGGYIDLDDVTEDPGDAFSNWIHSAKTKLRMREMKLMQKRILEIKTIILENIKTFENDSSTNNNQAVDICISERDISELVNKQFGDIVLSTMTELNKELETWCGIQLNQTSRDLSSFRAYFKISRNWFDQKKKRIKANHFWIAILNATQQFAQRVSKNYVWSIHNDEMQRKYYHNLFQQIMHGIFKSEITFAATKPQPLLPSGMIKDIKSIKTFILQYFGEYLDVDKILALPQKGKSKVTAAKVREILIERLQDLLEISKQQFHESLDLCNNYNNDDNVSNNYGFFFHQTSPDSFMSLIPNDPDPNPYNYNLNNFNYPYNEITFVMPPDESTYAYNVDASPSSMPYCPSMSPVPFVEGIRYHPFQCGYNNINNINNLNYAIR